MGEGGQHPARLKAETGIEKSCECRVLGHEKEDELIIETARCLSNRSKSSEEEKKRLLELYKCDVTRSGIKFTRCGKFAHRRRREKS